MYKGHCPWMVCVLTDRQYKVNISSTLSHPYKLVTGVHQGSVLESLLNIYIWSLFSIIDKYPHITYHAYMLMTSKYKKNPHPNWKLLIHPLILLLLIINLLICHSFRMILSASSLIYQNIQYKEYYHLEHYHGSPLLPE